MFYFIKDRYRFFFSIKNVYIVNLKIIIKSLIKLNYYLGIDNINYKFNSYILFLAKFLNIKIVIRVFINNFILYKKKHFFNIKFYYHFFCLLLSIKIIRFLIFTL